MTAAPSLPDAAPANWVDRYAPAWAQPWLRLGRFDRPIGIWLLLIPCWCGMALGAQTIEGLPDLRLFGWFAVGAMVMRAAGCAFNDIVDRDLDAGVARTRHRPVASGQISVRDAAGFIVACCAIGLIVLVQLGAFAIFLSICALALVAAYPFMKRITWWPQAWLGLTFNWGALVGYAAVTGTLNTPALLLYAGLAMWTLGYDTIYACQDTEDDALVGIKSTARLFGDSAPAGVMVCYAISSGLIALAAVMAQLHLIFYPLFGIFVLLLIWQARRLTPDDPQQCLGLFRSNQWAGLLLAAALLAGGTLT